MNNETPASHNYHKDIENRWTTPGDITDVPRLSSGFDTYANASSTRFLTSRSYLNLANIRLGYTFPKNIVSNIKLGGLSVYVSGDNLFMLSKRKGFVSMSSISGASGRSQYLPVSTIVGGIKVDF
ncbi:TonB-dependent receptor [Massilibacteroides sp.]|uniref:TonB-dependent receptor n=1 Tax=Massilibacteroides sp. TaxID=2034766 RepID=UPI0026305428|nr:TonB-dependent receptor [Massilibacteroides sp.]MDD4515470.1 TonB-dependent receptor [Massilibacteroides sp.]